MSEIEELKQSIREEFLRAGFDGMQSNAMMSAFVRVLDIVAMLDKRYAAMWHNHKNVQPYVFEGSANWTSCPKCATKYPEGEHHACPDIRFDLLGRPK